MMDLFALLEQLAIFLIIAYLFSKSPAFKPLAGEPLLAKYKVFLYLIFSGFAILGSYIGLPTRDALINLSSIGTVLAGLIAGPLVGAAVGATSGLHSGLVGESQALSLVFTLSATIQGLFGGLLQRYYLQKNKSDKLFSPLLALLATLSGTVIQLLLFLLLLDPVPGLWPVSQSATLSYLLANPLSAGLFMLMLRDQRTMFDKVGAMFSAKAFNIAERSLGIFAQGFNAQSAHELAKIIYDETGVGAVGISDCDKILAFVGAGADHHLSGLKIVSPQTKEAIRDNKVIFADGVKEHFTCALSADCPLGSTLIVPLREDSDVVGCIKLYEPKNKLFLNLNKTLGEGIAKLLSEQLLRYRYENQKNLLVKSELKLIQAQVNPHFLFNALNTIVSVVRKNPAQARDLLLHLSNYFRKNLKRSGDLATLEEELDHVNSYLFIQKTRFGDKLQVEQEIDPQLLRVKLPTFTLQPIVENAVKHGISNMLEAGTVRIIARREKSRMVIEIEDDAGNYCSDQQTDGLGMTIVDKRIKNLHGSAYGTEVSCIPNEVTRVTLILPLKNGDG